MSPVLAETKYGPGGSSRVSCLETAREGCPVEHLGEAINKATAICWSTGRNDLASIEQRPGPSEARYTTD